MILDLHNNRTLGINRYNTPPKMAFSSQSQHSILFSPQHTSPPCIQEAIVPPNMSLCRDCCNRITRSQTRSDLCYQCCTALRDLAQVSGRDNTVEEIRRNVQVWLQIMLSFEAAEAVYRAAIG